MYIDILRVIRQHWVRELTSGTERVTEERATDTDVVGGTVGLHIGVEAVHEVGALPVRPAWWRHLPLAASVTENIVKSVL